MKLDVKKTIMISLAALTLLAFLIAAFLNEGTSVNQASLDVYINVDHMAEPNARLVLRTNLPVGTVVSVSIRAGADAIFDEELIVEGDERGSHITTGRLQTNRDVPLEERAYTLDVRTLPASQQIAAVTNVIGQEGEFLTGNLVRDSEEGGQFIMLVRAVSFEGGRFIG